MIDVTLKIILELRGPVISKSTSAGSFGIDAVFATDENGDPILPRGLIKGKLRQSVEELGDLGVSFGTGWAEKYLGNDSGDRGLLDISRFRLNRTSKEDRYRIEIDGELGTSKKGSFQVIEMIAESGETIEATGEIKFYSDDETAANTLAGEILQAFSFITSFGADKSTGFGELIGISHQLTSRVMLSAETVDSERLPPFFHIRLKPDSPFCIAKAKRYPNIFESETMIPGNVIKGCIANTWAGFWAHPNQTVSANLSSPHGEQDYPNLKNHFEKIRFSHAYPTQDQKTRPVVVPYSIVDAGGRFEEVALESEARLYGDRSPAFQIDWKGDVWGRANNVFGWNDPPRKFEVRNAHERLRRKAADEELFAYEMVVPKDHHWLGTVDLSRVPAGDREAVGKELRHLIECLQEIRFLGKTKARAKVKVGEHLFDAKLASSCTGNQFVITLQSDALLADPYSEAGPVATETELRTAYKNAWNDISGGALGLVNYFAGQHLAGGDYLAHRFMKSKPYNPYFLTNAGSVFVLEDTGRRSTSELSNGKTANRLAEEWNRSGLPLPKWAKERHGELWNENPYIPENGYGEIAVNLQPTLNGGES